MRGSLQPARDPRCDNAPLRIDATKGKDPWVSGGIRALVLTSVLTLAGTTAALAGPLKGKTYKAAPPRRAPAAKATTPVGLHAGGNIVLRVAGNGRSVSVRFSSPYPLLYCNTNKALQVQSTKAARISGSGAFTASIAERFKAGPGLPPIVQVISGRFSGGNVSGKIQTNAAECSGVTYFSARAR